MERSAPKPEIVRVLERYPNGSEIDTLAVEMKLTEKQVRGRIDRARIPGGWNIKNVALNTFQLKRGQWPGGQRGGIRFRGGLDDEG